MSAAVFAAELASVPGNDESPVVLVGHVGQTLELPRWSAEQLAIDILKASTAFSVKNNETGEWL
jgi:hypothetical protein